MRKRWWSVSSAAHKECDADTDYAMYSAGYRSGQRLAHVGPLTMHWRSTEVTADPYLIRLGANAYAHGFADGWSGLVPDWTPLLLSDTDNYFMGSRP